MEVDDTQAATSTTDAKDSGKDEKVDKPTAAPAAGGGGGELPTAAAIAEAALPEVEVYLSTLALTTLLRHKATADAVGVAPMLLERAASFNRRCDSFTRYCAFCGNCWIEKEVYFDTDCGLTPRM